MPSNAVTLSCLLKQRDMTMESSWNCFHTKKNGTSFYTVAMATTIFIALFLKRKIPEILIRHSLRSSETIFGEYRAVFSVPLWLANKKQILLEEKNLKFKVFEKCQQPLFDSSLYLCVLRQYKRLGNIQN